MGRYRFSSCSQIRSASVLRVYTYCSFTVNRFSSASRIAIADLLYLPLHGDVFSSGFTLATRGTGKHLRSCNLINATRFGCFQCATSPSRRSLARFLRSVKRNSVISILPCTQLSSDKPCVQYIPFFTAIVFLSDRLIRSVSLRAARPLRVFLLHATAFFFRLWHAFYARVNFSWRFFRSSYATVFTFGFTAFSQWLVLFFCLVSNDLDFSIGFF